MTSRPSTCCSSHRCVCVCVCALCASHTPDCGLHPAYTGQACLPYFDMIDDIASIDVLLLTQVCVCVCVCAVRLTHPRLWPAPGLHRPGVSALLRHDR